MTDPDQTPFLTAAECTQLAEMMDKKYRSHLDGRRFSIEATREGETVSVRVLLANEDESFYYPVEGRIMAAAEELTVLAGARFLVDYIDMYFEEFLESGEETYVRIDWDDQTYDAVNFQLRGQILNRRLEKIADKLLREGSELN